MFGFKNRKESGAIVINGSHVQSTQQCVHCGRHELITPGSGIKRGWCMKCNGFACGHFLCMVDCVPYEAKIEYEEALQKNNTEVINKLSTTYPHLLTLFPPKNLVYS